MAKAGQFGLDALTDSLTKEAGPSGGPPPVERWNPPFCGDLDMRIGRCHTEVVGECRWRLSASYRKRQHRWTSRRRAPLPRYRQSIGRALPALVARRSHE